MIEQNPTHDKIILFYAAIALEVVVFAFQTYQGTHAATLGHQVAERYAALLLIILWVADRNSLIPGARGSCP